MSVHNNGDKYFPCDVERSEVRVSYPEWPFKSSIQVVNQFLIRRVPCQSPGDALDDHDGMLQR